MDKLVGFLKSKLSKKHLFSLTTEVVFIVLTLLTWKKYQIIVNWNDIVFVSERA